MFRMYYELLDMCVVCVLEVCHATCFYMLTLKNVVKVCPTQSKNMCILCVTEGMHVSKILDMCALFVSKIVQ